VATSTSEDYFSRSSRNHSFSFLRTNPLGDPSARVFEVFLIVSQSILDHETTETSLKG
jgi:hypothetical protein